MVRIAVMIITNEQGEILLCRRGAGGSCGGLWEFPGGKIEPGESAEACAERECQEELGVAAKAAEVYAAVRHAYTEQDVEIVFLRGAIVTGRPQRRVHTALRWVKQSALGGFDFCPANETVIERLVQEVQGGIS